MDRHHILASWLGSNWVSPHGGLVHLARALARFRRDIPTGKLDHFAHSRNLEQSCGGPMLDISTSPVFSLKIKEIEILLSGFDIRFGEVYTRFRP